MALASSHCSGGGSGNDNSGADGSTGGSDNGGAGGSGGSSDAGGSHAGGSNSGGSAGSGASVGGTWLDEPSEMRDPAKKDFWTAGILVSAHGSVCRS